MVIQSTEWNTRPANNNCSYLAALTYDIANNVVDFRFRWILSEWAYYSAELLTRDISITITIIQREALLDLYTAKRHQTKNHDKGQRGVMDDVT